MSPAYMMFGRQLRDALPSNPDKCSGSKTMSFADRYGRTSDIWGEIRERRELASARKQANVIERYDKHTRPLASLSVGDSVSIQNKSGSKPLRWDRTGKIVERLENRQYLVKMDGSGNVLLRTRTHLRKIDPTTREGRMVDSFHDCGADGTSTPLMIPGTLDNGTQVIDPLELEDQTPATEYTPVKEYTRPSESQHAVSVPSLLGDSPVDSFAEAPTTPSEMPTVVRRSSRLRNRPKRLELVMTGKHHEECE